MHRLHPQQVRGGAVVVALRHKPEGHRIDSRWSHWNFSLTYPSGRPIVLGSTKPLNRNEYQEYIFLGGKAAGA
jgi:hypothetical protein